MTDPVECRRNADACLHAAQTAQAPELKATLLTMARLWTALAVQTERLQKLSKQDTARSQEP